MSDFSRRTVVRGFAWTVPVIAVAAQAPAFATSHEPPPPVFDFSKAYKNPGDSCRTLACIPKQSYGVPVTVTNSTFEDYYIQFTSYFIDSTNVGVFGITSDRKTCTRNLAECAIGTCPGLNLDSTNTVCVPAGSSLTFEVTSNTNGSSPNGGQKIDYRWIRKSGCTVTSTGQATSAVSPPLQAC